MFKYWGFRSSLLFWQFLPQPGQGSSRFFPMEVKQTQNLAERRDQPAVFCGQDQTEGTTWWHSRQRKWMKILHQVQLQGVQPVPSQRPLCSSVVIWKFLIISSLTENCEWSPLGSSSVCLNRGDRCRLGVCHSLPPPPQVVFRNPRSPKIWWVGNTREIIIHQDSKWVRSQRVTSTTEGTRRGTARPERPRPNCASVHTGVGNLGQAQRKQGWSITQAVTAHCFPLPTGVTCLY